MELVVKVSEKDYLNFMLQYDNGVLDETVPSHRAKIAIANGTLLPKGHGRLIDADALEECEEIMNTITGESKYAVRMDDIRNVPTIIEADKEGAEE